MAVTSTARDGAAAAAPTTHLRAIGLYCMAILVLSLMDVAIKWLSADYHTLQILFFRAGFAMIPLAFLVARGGGIAALRTRRPGAHLLRGLVGTATAFSFFFSFAYLPLADAYAIAFAAPLFVTALSVPLLGERVGARRWSAVAVGFCGVLLIVRPGGGGIDGFVSIGAAAALAGAFGYALMVGLMRLHSRTESPAAITVYPTLVTLAVSGLLLAGVWTRPSLADLGLLAVTGILGGVGTILLAAALRGGPVAVLAPFEYSAMVWGVAFGFAIWGDLPDGWTWAGTAVVVASGLYILHREHRRGGTAPTAGAPTAPVAAASVEAPATPEDQGEEAPR
ncbi:MAG: DMT family transporter [Azospirillaceae bacterium]